MTLKRNLMLTSPLMKGDDVRALQNQLKKRGWYDGEIDGEFGKITAAAVYRAKYKLGYPNGKLNRIAGPALYEHLTGAKQSKAMKARAAARARATKKRVNKRHELAKQMLRRVGKLHEKPPNSNNVPGVTNVYGKMIGLKNFIGAWCAMVISVCAKAIGVKFVYAYVPYIVADAIRGRNGLVLKAYSIVSATTGTIVCYDWQMSKRSEADHTGVAIEESHLKTWSPSIYRAALRRFGPLRQGEFWCIEGNTAIGNDSNGGKQEVRKRHIRTVEAFVQFS